MLINRSELLNALEIIKPALATEGLHPELFHVWSDGKNLVAYNGANLGLVTPFKSGFSGGLKGSTLLGLLESSRAKEVEMTIAEAEVGLEAHLKAARAHIDLPLLPQEQALWQLPKTGKAGGFRLSGAFLEALKTIRLSVSAKGGSPDQLGVTILLHGSLQLYTTDSKTISWSTIKDTDGWPLKPDARILLPIPFVEQLIRLGDDKTELFSSKDDALAVTGKGVKIFTRLIDSPRPTDFKTIIDNAMKGIQLFTIPARLKFMMERASVMLGAEKDEWVDLSIEDDVLRVFAKTPNGEMKDSIRLEEFPKPISLRTNPELIRRGLAQCDRIGVSKETTVMTGKNFIYLIANFGG